MKYAFCLFIFSEVMFFFRFFWAFFHSCLTPSVFVGMTWPPLGVSTIDAFSIPLLNTIILLSSGITLTYAHLLLMEFKYLLTVQWLLVTVCLGYLFARFQYQEYCAAKFTFSDSVYGSCFFMATGFHGFHVIAGAIFLGVVLYQMGYNIDDSF